LVPLSVPAMQLPWPVSRSSKLIYFKLSLNLFFIQIFYSLLQSGTCAVVEFADSCNAVMARSSRDV
jgi:hypothetical protein